MMFLFGKQTSEAEPEKPTGIFGKTGNGTLDFYLSKTADWRDNDIEDLNISVWTSDFDSIYQSALRSKGIEPADTSGRYDGEKYIANLTSFISEFPQNQMMVSFRNMYEDYVLGPTALTNLLGECEKLQKIELSSEADLALRKLTYGCQAALDANSYLLFLCD